MAIRSKGVEPYVQTKGRARQNNAQLSQEGFLGTTQALTQKPGDMPNTVGVPSLRSTKVRHKSGHSLAEKSAALCKAQHLLMVLSLMQ